MDSENFNADVRILYSSTLLSRYLHSMVMLAVFLSVWILSMLDNTIMLCRRWALGRKCLESVPLQPL